MWLLVPPEPTWDSAPGPDFCGSEWEEMGCWSLAPTPFPRPKLPGLPLAPANMAHVHPSG